MFIRSLIVLIISTLIIGCAGTSTSVKNSPTPTMFINATVVSSNAEITIVDVEPIDKYTGNDIERTLAAEVQNTTYLIEGSYTKIGNSEYLVKERRGNTLMLQGPLGLQPKQKVNLYIPKKTMIVSDLNVKGNSKAITGNIAFSELKARLSNSGNYVVVEREKLSAILQEHKLELSGLTDPNQASFVGKLLKAEILLSGDMIKVGGNCVFNIKAIEVPTSKVIGVINKNYLCSQVTKNFDIRSTEKELGSFESGTEKGWIVGKSLFAGGFTMPDFTTGANGTKASLRLSADKKIPNSVIINRVLRDVSGFTGVTFYAKANKELIAGFLMADAGLEGVKKTRGKWARPFSVGTEWRKYNIKLSELVPSAIKAGNFKFEDKEFTFELIDLMFFSIPQHLNEVSLKGAKFWIDEISFY